MAEGQERVICPLLRGRCIGRACAWYNEREAACAVLTIAQELLVISYAYV